MMSTRIGPRDLPSPVPAIRYLRIERYRGIEAFEWRPSPGMNVLVGPGDTCKSTILEAIAALLTPASNVYLSEFDYFRRKTDNGFSIEAAIAVGDASILKVEKLQIGQILLLTPVPSGGSMVAVAHWLPIDMAGYG